MSWPGSAVWVAVDEAERGTLPARCARTGERCITRYSLRAGTLNPYVEWLAWSRVWPAALLRPDDPETTVVVPLLPRIRRRRRVLTLLRDATAALLPVVLVIGLVFDGTVGDVAGMLVRVDLAVHAVVAALGLLLTVDLRLDHTGAWVRYDRVNPQFAEEARGGRRPPSPPQRRAARKGEAALEVVTDASSAGPPGSGAG